MRNPAFCLPSGQATIKGFIGGAGKCAQPDRLLFGHLFFWVGAKSDSWIKAQAVLNGQSHLLCRVENANAAYPVPTSPCIQARALAIMSI